MELTARQQDIVNAAINIIARQGYQELTTKRLAEVVGVSEAALYRHFDSKTDLIHKILEYFQTLAQEAMGSIHDDIKDPFKQVKAFVMNRYKLFMDNPDLARVMFSEEIYENDRSLAEHNLTIMHIHRDQLIKSIKAAQKTKQIRTDLQAIQLFRIIVGSMRLLVMQWQLSSYEFELQKEGVKLWQTIEKLITEDNK
ncbi:MAG: TetR/AcrR family transcriptional regulator [Candidatus Cloacimonadaceae bacterium]